MEFWDRKSHGALENKDRELPNGIFTVPLIANMDLRFGSLTQLLTNAFLVCVCSFVPLYDTCLFHGDGKAGHRRTPAGANRPRPPHVLGLHLPEVDSC